MRRDHATSSYSMPKATHQALSRKLPRFGDRSKLVARLIEMWLSGEIIVTGVSLKSLSVNVAHSNTTSVADWQRP